MRFFPEDRWPLPSTVAHPRLVAGGAVLVLALLGLGALLTGEAFVPVRPVWMVTGARAFWQGWHYLAWAAFVASTVLLDGVVARKAQMARLTAIGLSVAGLLFTGWQILAALAA